MEASYADTVEQFATALAVLSALPSEVGHIRALDETTLLQLNELCARSRQVIGTIGAVIAGEIAHRSAPAFGQDGLAQRTGFRTAEEFVKVSTGVTGKEAVATVRVGQLIHEAADAGTVDVSTGEIWAPSEPWLAPVAVALRDGRVSVAAADSIRTGLGSPNSAVSGASLEHAARLLCAEASTLDPDRLFKRARQARDELDVAGIAIREEERHAQRSNRLVELPDGMGRMIWTMEPETFAFVKEVRDRMTSPKLGGPRFIDAESQGRAESIRDDDRTAEQIASDGMLALLRLGASTDPSFMVGSGTAVVRVTATAQAIESGEGFGRIEGQSDAISLNTVERLRCEGATQVVTIDAASGQPLDVGREQRFFTRRQRVALSIRDGGCRWPGCDRPPSWTEAHHTRFWSRDHGETNVADGILLCRHHHLLLHNHNWQIAREGAEFWLTAPPDVDPGRARRPMPSKSPALDDLRTR